MSEHHRSRAPSWRRSRRGRAIRTVSAAGLLTAGMLVTGNTVALASSPGPALVVGVDHTDVANQDFAHGRVFEYTDFFSRSVTVHRGAVVDFRTAPGFFHVIALAKSEAVARRAYPVLRNDVDDPAAPSGAPKVAVGPGFFPIVNGTTSGDLSKVDFSKPDGPPDCGVPWLHQANCTFSGGTDIEVAGPNLRFDSTGRPLPADWRVNITAPEGTYVFFCEVHPGMRGVLHVVDGSDPATTQAQINTASARQFTQDRSAALRTERADNWVSYTGGAPGHRTYRVLVGDGAANDHVGIDEMFPNPATVPGGMPTLRRGDRVFYSWPDRHSPHSVFFPVTPNFSGDLPPVGFDCPSGYVPGPPCAENPTEGVEAIFDPGNAPSGTALHAPSTVVDSGVRFGRAYGLRPSSQSWSVTTTAGTAPGTYTFHCTIHDWMVGGFRISSS